MSRPVYLATITSDALITANASSPTARAEIVNRLIGDRRGHDNAAADIDADMGGRLALADRNDLTFELIARA